MTLAPCSAKPRAMAKPIPEVEPVTTAFLFFSMIYLTVKVYTLYQYYSCGILVQPIRQRLYLLPSLNLANDTELFYSKAILLLFISESLGVMPKYKIGLSL